MASVVPAQGQGWAESRSFFKWLVLHEVQSQSLAQGRDGVWKEAFSQDLSGSGLGWRCPAVRTLLPWPLGAWRPCTGGSGLQGERWLGLFCHLLVHPGSMPLRCCPGVSGHTHQVVPWPTLLC